MHELRLVDLAIVVLVDVLEELAVILIIISQVRLYFLDALGDRVRHDAHALLDHGLAEALGSLLLHALVKRLSERTHVQIFAVAVLLQVPDERIDVSLRECLSKSHGLYLSLELASRHVVRLTHMEVLESVRVLNEMLRQHLDEAILLGLVQLVLHVADILVHLLDKLLLHGLRVVALEGELEALRRDALRVDLSQVQRQHLEMLLQLELFGEAVTVNCLHGAQEVIRSQLTLRVHA